MRKFKINGIKYGFERRPCRTMHTLLSVFVICLLTSCLDKASYVNNAMKTQVDSASNMLLEFSQFRQGDGVEIQSGSLKYELPFTGLITARKNCYWDGTVSFSLLEQNKINLGTVTLGTDSLRSDFVKKDYGYHIKGTAVFEKRDNGWSLISIYPSKKQ